MTTEPRNTSTDRVRRMREARRAAGMHLLHLTLPAETVATLDAVCATLKLSRAETVRLLIEDAGSRHG